MGAFPEGRRFRAVFMKIPGDRPRPFLVGVSIFEPQSHGNSPPTDGATGGFAGLRNDEGMPVICPTCQRAFEASMPAASYFAWGCFRYFGSAARSKGQPTLYRVCRWSHLTEPGYRIAA